MYGLTRCSCSWRIINSVKTQLIIFGITGDLAQRKLLPALSSIIKDGHEDLSIIGVSRQNVSSADVLTRYPELEPHASVFTMSLADPAEYHRLAAHLGPLEKNTQRLYYLSVPPGVAADIADFLGKAGLSSSREKILFEKPFGYDLQSAEEFIERTGRYYSEEQIFRIDHYMAKEVARELLRLRTNADTRHHHWSTGSVAGVEIIAHETLGVEGRAAFYEQTGAIRDVIQGHLMQLLSLVLMKPPRQEDGLSSARLAALNQIIPVLPENAETAQYEGYRDEVASPNSTTETYAKLKLFSADPAWKDVPLILETGKRMPSKQTLIRITYRDGGDDIFDESLLAGVGFGKDAYEHVLLDAIAGRRDIFTTSDEVLASWRVLEPLFEHI